MARIGDEMQALTAPHSMNRIGEASEITHLVHFLMSDRASFPTADTSLSLAESRGRPFITTAARAMEQAGAVRCG